MTESTVEILILALNALGAGLLMFIATVLQQVMNNMGEHDFKRFVNALGKTAMSDPFAVTVATLPILAAPLYLIVDRFSHWWFIAGILVWIVGSTMTKVVNLPVYRYLLDPEHDDPTGLRAQRRKLQLGNNLRAWTTLLSVVLMLMQFSISATILGVLVFAISAVPFTMFSRSYKLA